MYTGAAFPVSAELPSPTRTTTNDCGLFPPPEPDDDDDELGPEPAPDEDEFDAPPVPFPPIPLLAVELLDDCAPQSAPSPPWPFPKSGRVVPWAHATTMNGVRANEVKAMEVVDGERCRSTAVPFFSGRGSTPRFTCHLRVRCARGSRLVHTL